MSWLKIISLAWSCWSPLIGVYLSHLIDSCTKPALLLELISNGQLQLIQLLLHRSGIPFCWLRSRSVIFSPNLLFISWLWAFRVRASARIPAVVFPIGRSNYKAKCDNILDTIHTKRAHRFVIEALLHRAGCVSNLFLCIISLNVLSKCFL